MSELQDFRILSSHAEYRPAGEVSQSEMVQLVEGALAFASEQRVRKLLVVTAGLTGFAPPSIGERYFMITRWANASSPGMRTAFLARPEMIDRQKFGNTVASNNGFVAEIFPSEEEALAWLHGARG